MGQSVNVNLFRFRFLKNWKVKLLVKKTYYDYFLLSQYLLFFFTKYLKKKRFLKIGIFLSHMFLKMSIFGFYFEIYFYSFFFRLFYQKILFLKYRFQKRKKFLRNIFRFKIKKKIFSLRKTKRYFLMFLLQKQNRLIHLRRNYLKKKYKYFILKSTHMFFLIFSIKQRLLLICINKILITFFLLIYFYSFKQLLYSLCLINSEKLIKKRTKKLFLVLKNENE